MFETAQIIFEGHKIRVVFSLQSSVCIQVDKQEKKKKKTGRAKRRMQYNRRYVNVVQGFGRRKGPNANS